MSIPDHKVSVIIPTKNAGREFSLLLAKLKAQRGVGEVEIVIVDSGSSDGTPDIARGFGCELVKIVPSQFTHGHARNKGAEKASGDFLLFMTQDALPSSPQWIADQLNALLNYSRHGVVAVSCTEFPRADSDLYYNILMEGYHDFLGCRKKDRVMGLNGAGGAVLRQNAQLANTACLIKKSIFDRYRFQRDYAEDLDLGARLIRDGHKLAFLASAKVIHSHNRPPFYFMRRAFIETVHVRDIFQDFKPTETVDFGDLSSAVCLLFQAIDSTVGKLNAAEEGLTANQLHNQTSIELIHGLIAAKSSSRKASLNLKTLQDKDLLYFLDYLFRCNARHSASAHVDALARSVLASLSTARRHLNRIYPILDKRLLAEYSALLFKSAACLSGAHFAQLYLACKKRNRHPRQMARLKRLLSQGV